MNRNAAVLATLLVLAFAGHGASAEVRSLHRLKAAPAPVQAPMAIPDNVLTGHGAIATPDGRVHF